MAGRARTTSEELRLKRGYSFITPSPEEPTWGTLEVISFTANYMVGTGFLTLPHAIKEAGVVLGTLVIIAAGGLATVAADCVLEALARATAMGVGSAGRPNQPYGTIPEDEPADDQGDGNVPGLELTAVGGNGGGSSDGGEATEGELLAVGSERVDMPQLCQLFLGERGKFWYGSAIVFYVYASLWAYAVLVATTLSVALPLADPFDPEASAEAMNLFSYRLYLLAFGVVSSFIATKDITGPFMSALNTGFTWGRVLMAVVMVVTLALALLRRALNGDMSELDDSARLYSPAPMFRPAGLVQMLPTGMFAFIFHHSIPTLAEPAKDKPGVGTAFATTINLVVVAYLLISVPAVIYFGEETLPAASLNWNSYKPEYWPPLAALVRGFVVFFPACSLLSTYPLMCITLANQLVAILQYPGSRYESVPRYVVRLIAAVPPVVLSAVMNDLSMVTAIAGVCGFVVTLVFPVLLQRTSRKAVEAKLGPGRAKTAHTTFVTASETAIGAAGLVGFLMTVLLGAGLLYNAIIAPVLVMLRPSHGEWN